LPGDIRSSTVVALHNRVRSAARPREKSMSATTASLKLGDKSVDLPIKTGTIGPSVIDIGKLYAQTGMFTYDPGFTSTASTESTNGTQH
jgi:hypothetical protein